MADYLASFHAPEFSDSEFEKKKAGYVAEHGYTITIPAFRDVIKLGGPKRMTDAEKKLYYSGRRKDIPEARRKEIGIMKADQKFHMESMLSSPMPRVGRAAASIMQTIDDAQDFLIVAAAIGRIALKLLPRIALRFLGWPITVLWLISTALNYLTAPTYCLLNPMGCKRKMKDQMLGHDRAKRAKARKGLIGQKDKMLKNLTTLKDSLTGATPAMKRDIEAAIKEMEERISYINGELATGLKGSARRELKNARRYVKSGSVIPSFAEGIQALQVSKDIWGYGVAIGPMMGFLCDLYSGGVRWARGEKVSFRNTPTEVEIYQKVQDREHTYARTRRPRGFRSQAEFEIWKIDKKAKGEWGYKNKFADLCAEAAKGQATAFGMLRKTNWQEETALYVGAEIAASHVGEMLEYWDPIENIEGMEHIEIEARVPANPLIWECFEEAGLDIEKHIGWPSLGKRWATYEEICSSVAPIAAENVEHVLNACKDQTLKSISTSSAREAGLRYIAAIIGEEDIEIEDHAAITIVEMLLDHGMIPPRDITESQLRQFGEYCINHQDADTRPTLREVLAHVENNYGFQFVPYTGKFPEI